MKLKLSLVIGMLALALSAVVAVAAPTASAKTGGGTQTGTFTGTALTGEQVDGTFVVNKVAKVNGVLTAFGTYTYTAVNGSTVDPGSKTFSAPITAIDGHPIGGATTAAAAAAAASGSCSILDLTLGPLHLDLLGLVVDLNAVHLQITAQPGPGNLLGNLLCAVAGLLDNTGGATGGLSGLLNQLTNLLNQILAQL